jgi:hypothetical protein
VRIAFTTFLDFLAGLSYEVSEKPGCRWSGAGAGRAGEGDPTEGDGGALDGRVVQVHGASWYHSHRACSRLGNL